MSWSDPIADLLTRIRNAAMADHKRVDVPASKYKEELVKLLVRERFLKSYKRIDEGPQGTLRIYMSYEPSGASSFAGLERVSKPGRRIYVNATKIPRVRSGLGVTIMTTPKGVLTDQEARKLGVGGEIIAKIW